MSQPARARSNRYLFFAYGDDLDVATIAERCGGEPEVLAVARLADYALSFHGRDEIWDGGEETLKPRPGGEVWGVVYRLSGTALDRIDIHKRVKMDGSGAYFHSPVDVVAPGGEVFAALIHRRADGGKSSPPSRPHRDLIAAAALKRGLPADYVEALAVLPAVEASPEAPRRWIAEMLSRRTACAC